MFEAPSEGDNGYNNCFLKHIEIKQSKPVPVLFDLNITINRHHLPKVFPNSMTTKESFNFQFYKTMILLLIDVLLYFVNILEVHKPKNLLLT